MATITHKGNTVHSVGELPKVGSKAPGLQADQGRPLATLRSPTSRAR